MNLVEDIYKITSSFTTNEIFALTSQMKRAAVLVPSNISESAARQTTKGFII